MDSSGGRSRRLLQEYGRDSSQQLQRQELDLPRWLQASRYLSPSELNSSGVDVSRFLTPKNLSTEPPLSASRVFHSTDPYTSVPYPSSFVLQRDRDPSFGRSFISADEHARSTLHTFPFVRNSFALAEDIPGTSPVNRSFLAKTGSSIAQYGRPSNAIVTLEEREARLSLIDRYGSAHPMHSRATTLHSSDSSNALQRRPSIALHGRFSGEPRGLPSLTAKEFQKKQGLMPTKVIQKKKGKLVKDVEIKKENSERSKEVGLKKNQEQANEELEDPIEGMIFGCNNKTKRDCKKLQLFGLPSNHQKQVLRIMPGSKLFLFDYDSKNLTGVFEATSRGGMDIVPDAFRDAGSFPAQVRIKRVMKVPSLSLEKFKEAVPDVFYKEKKFKHELNSAQVAKLVEAFVFNKDKAKA